MVYSRLDSVRFCCFLHENVDTSFCTRWSGSSQLASDKNLVEDSMYWSRVTLQTNTEHESVVRDVPFVYITFLDTLLE